MLQKDCVCQQLIIFLKHFENSLKNGIIIVTMNYDLSTLNEEQLSALKQTEGAVLVTAGAGSGKTKLLTYRIAYLIGDLGVSPYNILAITFTNKAAGEMRERVAAIVDGADRIWISTFHSMCAKILRMEIENLSPFTKDFTIYSESDSEKVLKEVLTEHAMLDEKFKKTVAFHLSNWKNGNQTLEDYLLTHKDEYDMRRIGQCIMAYQDKLKKNNALDFDDLLLKTVEIFKKYPEILEKYAYRFRYILVDEFQDTNTVQYNIVKMLAQVHGNIFVVGDEDQCIYSWRGANFQNIFNIKKDFPDAKVFKLERNYRSTKEIISVANNVIKNNKSRLNKNMWTEKNEGEKPVVFEAFDERDEASFVARNISKLVNEGYSYKDFAVLMRLNALSRSFEEAFLSYNIPHRVFGGFKFYERVEIKNIVAYLRLFINPKDDVSFARVINFPKRGIGDGTIAKLQALNYDKSLLENVLSQDMKDSILVKKFQSFIEGYEQSLKVSKENLSKFVENVISSFKIREAYNPKDDDDLDRLLNIDQFISSVKEFEALNPDASLGDFLENITLASDVDEIGSEGSVTIATIHAVKGLEFKCVFVVGLEEGLFPISRAFDSIADMEEERRLMYVAITRAEEKLYLSHCTKRYMYGQSQYQSNSRFLKELGLIEFASARKSFGLQDGGYKKTYGGYHEGQGVDIDRFNSYSTESPQKIFNHDNFFKKEEPKPRRDFSVYEVGQTVEHPRYGVGQIVEISSDGLVGDIVFEDFGRKSLMLDLAPLTIIE